MSFNKVVLLGNLTRDPELKHLQSGSAICEFSIALNRKFKGGDGAMKEEVAYIDCKAWGKTGETIKQYFGKASPILVEGRLTQDSWEDKASGGKRTKLLVTVESFAFTGAGARPDAPRDARMANPQVVRSEAMNEDDIPF